MELFILNGEPTAGSLLRTMIFEQKVKIYNTIRWQSVNDSDISFEDRSFYTFHDDTLSLAQNMPAPLKGKRDARKSISIGLAWGAELI